MTSEEVRETLDRLEITQEEFAAAVGVTQSTVSRWLKEGKMHPVMALRVRQTAAELAEKKAS